MFLTVDLKTKFLFRTIKRFRMERAGVTQVLSRLSYISALGKFFAFLNFLSKMLLKTSLRAVLLSQEPTQASIFRFR